jgi:SAM-dependent methyltransferase
MSRKFPQAAGGTILSTMARANEQPGRTGRLLRIDEAEIRRRGPGNLLGVCWRQWRAERALARRGVHFRTTDVAALATAYAAMSDGEFDAINGRQDWANWRTIPRALSGHVPARPLRVLDLGCGSGGSTRVLAFYCPAGSRITGYELAAPLVEIARRRAYADRSGRPADVTFCCQGVTEPLRQPDGTPVADGSVDVVNASGVVGHHLDAVTFRPLIGELKRVLRPAAVALLDVGPTLGDVELSAILAAAGFARLGHRRSCWLDRTGQVIYRAA